MRFICVFWERIPSFLLITGSLFSTARRRIKTNQGKIKGIVSYSFLQKIQTDRHFLYILSSNLTFFGKLLKYLPVFWYLDIKNMGRCNYQHVGSVVLPTNNRYNYRRSVWSDGSPRRSQIGYCHREAGKSIFWHPLSNVGVLSGFMFVDACW